MISLKLKCPKCDTKLIKITKHKNKIFCHSCNFQIAFAGEFWDSRIDNNYDPEFSKQWDLWSKGWLGRKDLLYGNSETDEDFQYILDTLGISKAELYNKRILEIGFGTGKNLSHFFKYSKQVHGIDLVKPIKSYKLNPKSIVCGSLFSMPFDLGQFDIVVCQGVIHHTNDVPLAFKKVADQIAPGGLLFLYIYEKESPKNQKIRKLFPFSWTYPLIIRLGLPHFIGLILALRKSLLKRSLKIYQLHHGNYTLGAFDTLSPRWVQTFDPKEILSWFQKNMIVGKRISPSIYIGKKH